MALEWLEIRVSDVLIFLACLATAYVLNVLLRHLVPQWIERFKVAHEARRAQLPLKPTESAVKPDVNAMVVAEILGKSLHRPLKYMLYTTAVHVSLLLMHTASWAVALHAGCLKILHALMMLWFVWYIMVVTNNLTHLFSQRAQSTRSKLDDMLVPLISSLVKFLVLFAGTMLVIQALGYSVGSMIASLGIGGAALALASKDTLSNLFGAFVIFFDKPFEIGDWISVNGVEGEVEEIRLRTTVIRTWENSVVTLPNSALSTSNIDNFERRRYRKMDCSFGLLYSTTSEQVCSIVEQIGSYISAHAVQDPAHPRAEEMFSQSYYVGFKGFGDSSLDIEVIAFSVNRGKSAHMAVRQQILIEIMRIVEEAGSGFAFPTRTLEWSPECMPRQGVSALPAKK